MKNLMLQWILSIAMLFSIVDSLAKEKNPYDELKKLASSFRSERAHKIFENELANTSSKQNALENLEYLAYLSKELNDISLMSTYFECLGYYSEDEHNGLNETSTDYYTQALLFSEKYEIEEQSFRQLVNLGNYYFRYSQISQAYPYFSSAVTLLEKLNQNNIAYLWKYLITTSKFFNLIGEYSKAKELLIKSLTYKAYLEEREYIDLLITISFTFNKLNEVSSEKRCLEEILKTAQEIKDTSLMGLAYGKLGLILIANNELEKGIAYLGKDFEYNNNPEDDNNSGFLSLLTIAKVKFSKGNYVEALTDVRKIISLVPPAQRNYGLLMNSYSLIIDINDKMNLGDDVLLDIKEFNRFSRLYYDNENIFKVEQAKINLINEGYSKIILNNEQLKWSKGFVILLLSIFIFAVFVIKKVVERRNKTLNKITIEEAPKVTKEVEYEQVKLLTGQPKHQKIVGEEQLYLCAKDNLLNDHKWRKFKEKFEEFFPNYFNYQIVHYPTLTESDLRLLALCELKLTNRELAETLSVSIEGVKKAKQRLKKKIILV